MNQFQYLQSELGLIRDAIISKVGAHLKDSHEAETVFLKWANEFKSGDPAFFETFEELKPHITWPI